MQQLPTESNIIILLRTGAVGYILGFLSWPFYISNLVLFLVGYPITFPMAYNRMIPTIIYLLLSTSFFLSSFGCLAFTIKHNSKIAMLCFVSYVATGIAWVYSLFNQGSWFILGYSLMIIAQLTWAITLLSNQKHISNPQGFKMIEICFIFSIILCVFYWPIIGYFGFISWLVGIGWLYAIGTVASAILLIKLSKSIPTVAGPL